MSENNNVSDNEYKTLNEAHIGTIKELNRIVREQAKQLEHINVSKYDTCCKYITISVIAIALFATIALCCIFGQRCNQYPEIECVSSKIKVQIEEK
jgi:hypothetical protein